jgi:cytochrome c-type biogenesis protein CcmF
MSHTVEIGHFALVLTFAIAVTQVLVTFWGVRTRNAGLMRVSNPASHVQFVLLVVSIAALTWAYVSSDFSVLNVWQNSHSAKPLIYKISGVWANHEGSMLLWLMIIAMFGSLVAMFGRNLPLELRANVLAVQASITAVFALFIIATSNPFSRIAAFPLPTDGRGLNPILQDPALAFHPPFLYVGYVGFSMAFSFAVAALIEGKIDAAWARWVRPWVLTAWVSLTIGISMGSWWAYYELGWGGWWFWDPVENASFMPWLAGTALLHSALVMERREALKVWTILLAILTFSLSLMGAFLVRSGVLTSVHSFASSPERGVFILAIMAFYIGGSLALYAYRAPVLKQGGIFAPISREGSLVVNNILLTAACGAVLVGTLYPLAIDMLTSKKISVGPPFFNSTFGPLMIPLLVLVPFGPLFAWKRGDAVAASQRLMVAAGLAFVATALTYAVYNRGPVLAPFGIGLGIWLIVGAMSEVAFRVKMFQASWREVLRRSRNLPRAVYGTVIAHAGLGITLIGIVGTTAWQEEKIVAMQQGDTEEIAGYELTFKGYRPQKGPNYEEVIGTMSVSRDGRYITDLKPSKRRFRVKDMTTSEAAIYTPVFSDLYIVMGEELKQGGFSIRLYHNPLVRLIWIGALVMCIGGLFSLSDRRLRVGAPKRRTKNL